MTSILRHLVLWFVLLLTPLSMARLEFDSKANNVQVFGPYIKYNILKEPYSLGRYQFNPDEVTLEFSEKQIVNEEDFGKEGEETFTENFGEDDTTGFEFTDVQPSDDKIKTSPEKPTTGNKQQSIPDKKTVEEERQPQSEGTKKLFAVWPRFYLDFGNIKILSKSGRILLDTNFAAGELGPDGKYARFELEGEGEDLLQALQEPFKFCLDQKFEESHVKLCSNVMVYRDGKFLKAFKGKNQTAAKLNRKKAPKNAQISLSKDMKEVLIQLKFRSGFSITVQDKVRHLNHENVAIDPREKRIGIISGDGSVRPARLTIKDRFFSFIKEKNYYKNRYAAQTDWPQDLEDAEMEFAPFQTGASIQLYGLILPNVPPPFSFKLDDDIPIATYAREIDLTGTKKAEEVLAAKVKNELLIHENNQEFLWKFPAEKAGSINQNYLSLQYKDKDYFFSKRIFRANQTAVSGALALSTSPTLDIVPGYNFTAEHWFETVWGKQSWAFQRWGIAANIYETVQGFKPKEGFPENISVLPINADLYYRLSQGVRPVQSSFGLGLRYLDFKLFRSQSEDIQTRFLGLGAFWHTAPQKIIDDIFNIVPFFRYPKWMEISFFYYPLLLGPEQIGLSFSWQARGKLFFSRQWYLDASFNVNSISFKKSKISGVTAGADSFGIATAHGTIGVGYLFN